MTGQPLRPQDHKDGVSYVPALEGKPFDRGPILCDFPHFVTATMNIPNTSIRAGDWKLYSFWNDGPEQANRYELYNLKDDVGEENNLAAQNPEKVATLAAMIKDYIRTNDVLPTNRNEDYNGRTVGVWAANPNGSASAADGALVLKAEQPQFAARTRVTPSLVNGAVLEFEARSSEAAPLSVQWTSSAQKDFKEPQSRAIPLTAEWKPLKVEMPFQGRIGDIRFVLPEAGQSAEIRNVRLLTPEGTLMTKYEFY
jgi:hypothetical protein